MDETRLALDTYADRQAAACNPEAEPCEFKAADP